MSAFEGGPPEGRPQAPAVSVCDEGLVRHFSANLLAQDVDGHAFAFFFVAPVCPAIATWRLLVGRADLVNGSFYVIADQRAISTNLGFVASV